MPSLADMFFALSLPLAGAGAAAGDCPDDHAAYRLNWTANMANERNMSGLPTLAFAMSPDGPALPVEMKFDGPEHAFRFDSPRVVGTGTGALELEQRLALHDEYTVTELIFNRHVTNLSMIIEGLDESPSYTAPYRDTIMLGGWNKSFDSVIEPVIHRDDITQRQEDARRSLRTRLGREERLEIVPAPTGTYEAAPWSTLRADFPRPVSYVKMTFGSDADMFPPAHFSQTPGDQELKITDVSFCVPFGSRDGD